MRGGFAKILIGVSLPLAGLGSVLTIYAQSAAVSAQSSPQSLSDRAPDKKSIFGVIDDPAERLAFRNVTQATDPAQRLTLAEAFLREFPRSWVTAEAYALAASGALESGQRRQAAALGAASLKILPENPALRASLGALQAQNGEFAQAEDNVRQALIELDQFLTPASVPEQRWPEVKRQLQAACFFTLGRAEVSQALATEPPQERDRLLREAIADLARASECNARDAEIPYLTGLAYSERRDPKRAAAQFALAYRLGGALQAKSLQQLKKLYDASKEAQSVTFEVYVTSQPTPSPEASPPPRVLPTPPQPAYAGSEACSQCHSDVYEHWSHTGMARMFRPYRPQNIIGDFTGRNKFYDDEAIQREYELGNATGDGEQKLFSRMIIESGRHYFEIKQASTWHRYPVDYTIGSKWEQAYATRLPNGEIHVFPVQYNLVQKRWVNFWKTLDAPGSPRTDLGQWEKLDIYTSYQANCAVCHTSQLRNLDGAGLAVKNLEFREPGIDCEMCHGPGARHVAAMSAGKPYAKRPLDPPVDFSKISAADYVGICAQCHEQSAVRRGQYELNYSTQGDFFQHYLQRPYEEFSRKAFYKDGRFRGTAFMVESLTRSRCFREGNVTCGSCHDPHSADAASNPTSLRFRDHPDQMCVQCHSPFGAKEALERHTHHPAASEGSRCASCHMPRIMDALMFEARSHQIDEIPDADMTLRFGRDESPNACLLCHLQKDAAWVKAQMSSWNHGS